jgi:predicted kinase
MNRPLLVIVTGRPASGKSTLAHLLAREIKCPLVSRDEIKEGFVNTVGSPHHQLGDSANWQVYETFFDTIDLLTARNISVVAEAAFQHKLWAPRLAALQDKASIKIILCNASPELTRQRFIQRLATDPTREKFHGDDPNSFAGTYEPLSMNVPTLVVDTAQDYRPEIGNIVAFLLEKSRI